MSVRRLAAALVALALAVVGTAWVTRVTEGRRALAAAEAAFVRGDRVEAIVYARAAAEARCPSCSASERGYSKLEAIAKDAERQGDDRSAVAAWRAVRAALLATVVIERTDARRERADAEIARLEHRIDAAAAANGETASPAATEERLRAALASRDVPSSTVFALLTIGGVVFAIGAARFLRSRSFAAPELLMAALGCAVAIGGALLF